MRVANKTKEQLAEEMESLRLRIAELEKTEAERREIEEVTRRIEEEKLAILNTMSESVVYQNTQHRILWANRAAAQSAGLNREQLVGYYCYETWPQRKEPCVGCPAVKARESGKLQEKEITAPDGRVWFIQAYPIRDTNEHVAGIVEVMSEITENKQTQETLQAEKNKLQSVIDALEYGLTIQDTDYNIIYQNEPSKKATGDYIGQKCYRVYSGKEKVCDGCPVEKAFRDGKSHTSESSRVTPSGELQLWENTANPIRDARGRIVSCLELTRNITERRQVDEKIQQQNEFLSAILDSLTHPFYVLDANDYTIKLANRAAEMGSLSENQTCYSLTHKRDKPCGSAEHICPLEEVKKTKKPVVVEHIHYDGDGNARNIEVHGYPIFDAEGNVVQMIEYCLDITERKQAEQALADEVTRRHILVDQSRDGIVVLDENGKVYEANQRFADMLGYSGEEVRQLSVFDWEFLFPREQVLEMIRTVDEAGDHFETQHRRKDGTTYDVEISTNGSVIAGQKLIFCVCRDITERKQVEQALADEVNRRRILVEQSLDGIVVLNENAEVYEANQRFADMLGYTLEEVRELHTWDWDKNFPPEQLLEMGRNVDETGLNLETRHHRKDGSVIDVEISISGSVIAGKKLIFCVCRDITERKRAEEVLKESEGKYKTLAEDAPMGIYFSDFTGKFLYGNKKAAEIVGYKPRELIGQSFLKLKLLDSKGLAKAAKLLALNKMGKATGPDEFVLNRKDGTKRTVEIRTRITMVGGRKVVLGMAEDITERKRVEEVLQVEKNKLESVIGAMDYGLTIQDKEYNIIYQNETLKTLFGDRLGEKCYRVYEGKEKLCDGCPTEKAFKDGKSHTSERRVVMPSGEVNFWENTANPIRDAEGKIVSCLEIARNITERKQAEDALKESQRFGSSLLESSPNSIFVLNPDTSVKYANPAFEKLTGFTLAEITGKKAPYPWWPEEKRKEMTASLKNAMVTGGRRSERIFQKKNGERFWVAINSAPIMHNGKLIYFLINWLDITERKQAQQKFESLVESASDMIWETDGNGMFTFVSPKIKDILGYEVDEVVGKMKTLELSPKEEALKWLERFKELHAKQKPFSGFEITHLHKNGTPLVFEVSGTPHFDSAGNFKGFIGVNKDITERKRAEEEMQKMFESVTDGIIVVDLNGAITEANQRTIEMHGFKSRDELLGRSALELVAPSDHKKIATNMRQALKQGTVRGMEYTMLKVDGSEFPAELSTSVLKDVSGKPVGHITVSRDISRRKQGEAEKREMEQKAHLASRLASVGEMASGIAHEINNPLTSVIGFSQLLMEGDIPADIKEDVNIIHKEAQRAAGVAKNLLTFARKHAPAKQPTSMNSIIDGVLKLRAYEQRVNNIQVDSQLASKLPEVMADYSQLQQVFINIIINAEGAMIEANRGGTLTITTQRINNTVRASFSDDGPGITRENLNRIFDPFFTTKEVGKGTGLGLSVCHGIVAEHGGRMYARSKPGKGATFVVELPANNS